MVVSDIQLYEILKSKFGAQEAEAVVLTIERRVDKKFEDKKEALATKEDIMKVREEALSTKADLLKTIYLVGMGQYLAIVASILAILHFTK